MRVSRLKPFLILAAGALLVLGLAALGREANHRRQSATALRRERDRTAGLQTDLKAAEARRKRLENESANLRYQLSSLPKADSADEARRQARRNLARATLDYDAFVQGLKLPPETQHRLEAILAERRQREKDIRGAAAQQGLASADPSIAALLQQEQQRAKADITGLIGANGEAQLEEYDRSAPIRTALLTMANLAYEVPLTADQDHQLTALLEDSSLHYADGGSADDFGSADAEPLLAKARAFLSTDQLNAFRLAYARSQADNALRRRIAELQAQGSLPPGIDQEDP